LWLVLLESVLNRILGVDTLGQYVPPRVRYGMAWLLIRDAVESVACSDEWAVAWSFAQAHIGARGPAVLCTTLGNLSIAIVPRTTLAKPVTRPIVNLCNDM
jgi:hypothetical protein